MKKSEQFSLYEWIENLNEGRKNFNHESALQALQQLQDDLSLCNNSDNFVTSSVTSTLEVHCSEPNQQRTAFRHVEQPGPLPALVSASSADESKTEITDDELIARNLQYLNGINEDLTGWTMWRRIEGGKEYRYAKDREGRIRWERWFELEPIVIIEPASAES
ncbi:MAG: hypothetical protein K6U11_14755, partial [bacterium]|nr:hypothetical protein [bacterium]